MLRDWYVGDCAAGVVRWNRILESHGLSERLQLPDRKFNRNIGMYAGFRFDPDGVAVPRIAVLLMLRSAAKDNLRPRNKGISGLNHTPHATAVYASRQPLLSDSRNTRFQAARCALPGLDFHQPIAPVSWRSLCPPYPTPRRCGARAP